MRRAVATDSEKNECALNARGDEIGRGEGRFPKVSDGKILGLKPSDPGALSAGAREKRGC